MLYRLAVELLFFGLSMLLLSTASLAADESLTAGVTASELAQLEKREAVVKTDTYPTAYGARGASVKGYCMPTHCRTSHGQLCWTIISSTNSCCDSRHLRFWRRHTVL